MKDWQRIREAIDACRPDSQDLHSADFQDVADVVRDNDQARLVYDRTQRLDAALRRTFQDVEVPEGLEQRLAARLGLASAVASVVEQPKAAPPATTDPTPAVRGLSRRRWWIAALVTVSAAVMVIVGIATRPSQLTTAELSGLAQQWIGQATQSDETQWQPLDDQLARSLRWSAHRYQRLETPLDRHAVVFDFSSRQGRLYLIRFHPKQQVMLPQLPYATLHSSGQWRMGAWKDSQGTVYIAVAEQERHLEFFRRGLNAT